MAGVLEFNITVGDVDWATARLGQWCERCSLPSAVAFRAPLLNITTDGVTEIGELNLVACNDDGCDWWRSAR